MWPNGSQPLRSGLPFKHSAVRRNRVAKGNVPVKHLAAHRCLRPLRAASRSL
jgi:hypothetical protein